MLEKWILIISKKLYVKKKLIPYKLIKLSLSYFKLLTNIIIYNPTTYFTISQFYSNKKSNLNKKITYIKESLTPIYNKELEFGRILTIVFLLLVDIFWVSVFIGAEI